MSQNKGGHGIFRPPVSLREEATGNIHTNPSTNAKSMLRFNHLKKLAMWATKDTHLPSLGAFYGNQLATLGESLGLSNDPSLITCQRCETVLHPGLNSTVRIEKNRSKVKHKCKLSGNNAQNNVVYKCHFCLHQNLKRGTPKGHVKGLCPPKPKSKHKSNSKSSLKSKPSTKPIKHEPSKLENSIISKDEVNETDVLASQVVAKGPTHIDDSSATPSSIGIPTLLEGNKRKKNSTSKKAAETPSMSAKVGDKTVGASSKRRRKSWTSLKEIAQRNEFDKSRVANLTIPFFL
ncbi:PREDICTED: uncharacterized protein LOC109348999 [Lupinus angustifolius]|nr:PREDICTED: uncharacterized protein LOC109348999 [Lupinus angustifolius]XP_019445186.1 PREDICTED: uncharacterized protein LOC109348999 [Lupinus angustifolius]